MIRLSKIATFLELFFVFSFSLNIDCEIDDICAGREAWAMKNS